jgi:hypothetical protein
MLTVCKASLIFRVMTWSLPDGSGSPPGWLWAMMTAVARFFVDFFVLNDLEILILAEFFDSGEHHLLLSDSHPSINV